MTTRRRLVSLRAAPATRTPDTSIRAFWVMIAEGLGSGIGWHPADALGEMAEATAPQIAG